MILLSSRLFSSRPLPDKLLTRHLAGLHLASNHLDKDLVQRGLDTLERFDRQIWSADQRIEQVL